jgi:hypothetical protein
VPCVPRALAFGFGRAWTNRAPGVPTTSSDIAIGFARLWSVGVSDPQPGEFGSLTGIARVTGTHPAGPSQIGTDIATARPDLLRLAIGAGAVWVANAPTGTLTRIDPATARLAGGLQLARQ